MILLLVTQSWCKDYYPEHYEYRVGIYRDDTCLNTGKDCQSKAETVTFIKGLEFAFDTMGEKTKVEFSEDDDGVSTSENYYRYFFPDDCEEYLEGSSRGDREDFHSDG
jgi:hypothetical protein